MGEPVRFDDQNRNVPIRVCETEGCGSIFTPHPKLPTQRVCRTCLSKNLKHYTDLPASEILGEGGCADGSCAGDSEPQ